VDRLIDEFTLLLSPLMHLFKKMSSNDVAQHGHYIQCQKVLIWCSVVVICILWRHDTGAEGDNMAVYLCYYEMYAVLS